MPLSADVFRHAVNHLVLRVGLSVSSWLPVRVLAHRSREQREWEHELAQLFRLDEAVEERQLDCYRFIWSREGNLETVDLRPSDRTRRAPGLGELKQLFLPPPPGPGRPPGRPRSARADRDLTANHVPVTSVPEVPAGVKRGRGRPRQFAPEFTQVPEVIVSLSADPYDLVMDVKSCGDQSSAALFPMLCQGPACFYASMCASAPRFLFEGRRCPYQAMDLARHREWLFTADLAPHTPDEARKLDEVVRLEMQIWHIDRRLEIEGMMVPALRGISPTRGEIREMVPHPLLDRQDVLCNRRLDLLAELQEASFDRRLQAAGLPPSPPRIEVPESASGDLDGPDEGW